MAKTQLAAAELFGHDSGMIQWGCLTVEAEAFGCRIETFEDYYPRVVERPLAGDPNLNKLAVPNPSNTGRMPLVLEALTDLRRRSGEDLFIVAMVVSPFLVAAELRGMTELLTDFITDPPFVEALFERVTDGTQRYLEAILHTRACDGVMFENAECRCLL
jgi:uroporphyrinogen-III decarboxylase